MAVITHEGHYKETKVYERPPDTYTCDTCGKDLGRNKGIELGMRWDKEINGNDMTEYEMANFCSFDCLHKYPQTEDSKRFVRQIKWSDRHDFYINGFDFKDIGPAICTRPNCSLPLYKAGLCTEHLEEKASS